MFKTKGCFLWGSFSNVLNFMLKKVFYRAPLVNIVTELDHSVLVIGDHLKHHHTLSVQCGVWAFWPIQILGDHQSFQLLGECCHWSKLPSHGVHRSRPARGLFDPCHNFLFKTCFISDSWETLPICAKNSKGGRKSCVGCCYQVLLCPTTFRNHKLLGGPWQGCRTDGQRGRWCLFSWGPCQVGLVVFVFFLLVLKFIGWNYNVIYEITLMKESMVFILQQLHWSLHCTNCTEHCAFSHH